MKKFCKAIIFLIILAIINSQSLSCEDQFPESENDWVSLTTKEEREINTYCCYFEMEMNGLLVKECLKLNKEQIELEKNKVEELEKTGKGKLDCGITSESDSDSNSYSNSDSDSNSDSYYIQIKILLFLLVLL